MNEKRARAIRAVARDAAPAGAPIRQLVKHPRDKTTAINDPMSVRGIYRRLKRIVTRRTA